MPTAIGLHLVERLKKAGKLDLAIAVLEFELAMERYHLAIESSLSINKVCPTCKEPILLEEMEFFDEHFSCVRCIQNKADND